MNIIFFIFIFACEYFIKSNTITVDNTNITYETDLKVISNVLYGTERPISDIGDYTCDGIPYWLCNLNYCGLCITDCPHDDIHNITMHNMTMTFCYNLNYISSNPCNGTLIYKGLISEVDKNIPAIITVVVLLFASICGN